uniref:Nucleoside diphosphate-linked moiety X motif 6 n=2 Tax=Schistocephalus solidus TaxID=70667 RepID=A0A0X3P6Y6_SCHSO
MRFSCLLLLPGRIYGRHSSSFVPFMDRHNCLHFDLSTVVPTQKNCENVQSRILEQLSAVCNEVPPRCNAVWVHLLSSQCSLLPRLCAPPPDGQGFQLHHAKPKSLSLYRWLGPGDDRVPAFTTHQVAITAVISRTHDGHVLMVQENTPRLTGLWKFPSGRAQFGESIADATLREVYEETGLQPTFRALMGVRESNGIPSTFGTAEILALCHLSLSGSPTEIASQLKLCPIEIKAADWFPLSSILDAQVLPTLEEIKKPTAPMQGLRITPLTRILAEMLVKENTMTQRPAFLSRRRVASIFPGYTHDIYLPGD